MNVPRNSTAQPTTLSRWSSIFTRWSSISWLVPLVVIPVVGFAIYLGWIVFKEYQAYRQMDALITPIRAAGPSPQDAWLAQRFAETASSEATAAWSEILMLSGGVGWKATGDLPIIGTGTALRTLEIGAKWEDQKLVDDYLNEARPLLDLIYQAGKYPTPVWQPLGFRGFGTFLNQLQDSRQVARVLQLDFEHAIVGRDRVRAMRDLQAMQNTADAFDWDLFIVGELVNVALRSMRYGAIQRSLYADVWVTEDLEMLIDQTKRPLPLAQSWQRSMESEKAMAISYMEGPLFSPSSRLRLLEQYAQMEAVAGSPPGRFTKRASELEQQWKETGGGEDMLSGSLLPAVSAYAATFDRLERSRRLVLTSLAVKLFQLTNERWPKDLQELKQVGLNSEDWTLPGIGSLGYEIQADGQKACVWGLDESVTSGTSSSVVSAECPDYAGEELDKVQAILTVIR